MTRKFILIIFSCFVLLFVSICVKSIHISHIPNANDSEVLNDPIKNDEKEMDFEPKDEIISFYANANGPYNGTVNKPLKFFCTGTNIPNPKKFFWEFDDHNDNTVSEEKNPIHIYSEPGVYYVTLTVETEKNVYKDIAPVFIDCNGDHLEPYGGCFYYSDVNEYINFDASKSTSTGEEIIQYHFFESHLKLNYFH